MIKVLIILMLLTSTAWAEVEQFVAHKDGEPYLCALQCVKIAEKMGEGK